MAFLPVIIVFLLYFSGIPIAYALFASSLFYFGVLNTRLTDRPDFAEVYHQHTVIPSACDSVLRNGRLHYELCRNQHEADEFADVLTGHLPGGLAQVNVLLSMLMGGVSGSATPTRPYAL